MSAVNDLFTSYFDRELMHVIIWISYYFYNNYFNDIGAVIDFNVLKCN